jgi:hypothetical protein
MKRTFKHAMIASAVALGPGLVGVVLAEDTTKTQTPTTTESQPMTGKQKATAIGAGTGAAAGAVVGGPVGALVGAGVGAYVGNEGTDAHGKVDANNRSSKTAFHTATTAFARMQQRAEQPRLQPVGRRRPRSGDGDALRDFQAKQGLAATGQLDSETMSRLGINS